MPHIKNALIRYRVIDKEIRNEFKPFPSKLDLRRACEMELFGSEDGQHISDSTIEKDLFAMRQEMEAPIKYSKREKGYYYDNPNFSIHEVPLSQDDISSIQFALNTLSQFKQNEIFQQFGFALNKIIDKFSINEKGGNKENEEIIQFEQNTVQLGNEFLAPLFTAIKNNLIIYFFYESFKSQQKKARKVTPLLLKEYDNRWYLISYDMVKETIITYALDRMENLEVTEQKGQKPHNFTSDLFFKYAVGITASLDDYPQKVIFYASNIASKYIETQPFHKSQRKISETKEDSCFELYVLLSEELIRKILSFGGDIKVLEPISLQQELKKRIDAMKKNYV